MKDPVFNRLLKCQSCGAMYIINFEGDDRQCDHCIAEEELMNLNELHGSDVDQGIDNQ